MTVMVPFGFCNMLSTVVGASSIIHRTWDQEFAILLDYIPAGSPGDVTAHQDYVVMQKRA